MAMTEPQVAPSHLSPAALESVQAVLGFLSEVAQLPAVDRVMFSTHGLHMDLWVVLDRDDPETAEQVYAAEEKHLAIPAGMGADAHVVALDSVSEVNLPPAHVVFRR